jgi:iron-sulfur cluster repair protein YtfE (RIC family)
VLTQLGARAAPQNAVGLLLECHERIRAFLGLARRLGEPHVADEAAVADAAERVHRYFTEALPLHARDEEESIVPRLRGLDARVDAELERMVQEHREHEPPLRALVGACAELRREPGRLAALRPVVARAAAELARHFEHHLAREETVVFPAMRRLLPAATDGAIVGEIRARRRLPPAG